VAKGKKVDDFLHVIVDSSPSMVAARATIFVKHDHES
jgi:hypothetical protein